MSDGRSLTALSGLLEVTTALISAGVVEVGGAEVTKLGVEETSSEETASGVGWGGVIGSEE